MYYLPVTNKSHKLRPLRSDSPLSFRWHNLVKMRGWRGGTLQSTCIKAAPPSPHASKYTLASKSIWHRTPSFMLNKYPQVHVSLLGSLFSLSKVWNYVIVLHSFLCYFLLKMNTILLSLVPPSPSLFLPPTLLLSPSLSLHKSSWGGSREETGDKGWRGQIKKHEFGKLLAADGFQKIVDH